MSSDAAQGPSDEQKSALVERILRGEISTDEARSWHVDERMRCTRMR